jgi:hypothetical protein
MGRPRPQASEQVLAQLVEHFDLHCAILYYSNDNIRASVDRRVTPAIRRRQPDPFGVVSFTSDDPADLRHADLRRARVVKCRGRR